MKIRWTYHEFLAFLLLYAVESDYSISADEKNRFLSRLSGFDYLQIRKTFYLHNEEERLKEIQSMNERFFNNNQSNQKILTDMKELFLIDMEHDSIMQAVLKMMRNVM
jgi:hypothetical protein